MVRTLTATELKATILAVLDDVDAGDTVLVTKHGRTVARIVPARAAKPEPGFLAGVATTAPGADLVHTHMGWETG